MAKWCKVIANFISYKPLPGVGGLTCATSLLACGILESWKVSCFFLMVNLMETHGWEMIFWVLTQGRAPAASTESEELTPRHLAKKTMARQRIHSVLVACDHVFLLIWCKHGFSEESPSILSERKWSWLRTKSFAWCSYDIYDGSLNAIDGMGWWARYPSKA